MDDQFNQLLPAETERLALIAEEAAEVIQVIGKILRFGYNSAHPDRLRETNRYLLVKEIGDLTYALMLADTAHDFSGYSVAAQARLKASVIEKYLHHQDDVDLELTEINLQDPLGRPDKLIEQ